MAVLAVMIPARSSAASGTPSRPVEAGRLFDFDPAATVWSVVNDGVMGGVSDSSAVISKGRLLFTGRVRLDNNGGFASTRAAGSDLADSLTAAGSKVTMRVKGDGRTYQFTMRASEGAPWFWSSFRPPAGLWTIVEIPYERLRPHSRFGDPIAGPSYDGRAIGEFGFLIANGRAERFRLEVDWISFTP